MCIYIYECKCLCISRYFLEHPFQAGLYRWSQTLDCCPFLFDPFLASKELVVEWKACNNDEGNRKDGDPKHPGCFSSHIEIFCHVTSPRKKTQFTPPLLPPGSFPCWISQSHRTVSSDVDSWVDPKPAHWICSGYQGHHLGKIKCSKNIRVEF